MGGAELVLRSIGKFQPPEYPPQSRQPELYEADARYGYALRPNQTASYEYPPGEPRTIIVHSDAYGFRNTHDMGAEDPRVRVLVVGDSYTFGEGVQEGERFTDYLQEMEPEWRVDNIGMPGYGPDLMFLALKAILPLARPDIVVISLFFDDFRRVRPEFSGLGYASPRFELRAGQLVEVEYPKPKLWERSHLYNAIRTALSGRKDIFAPLTEAEWSLNEVIQDSTIAFIRSQRGIPVYTYLSGPWTHAIQQRRRQWVEDVAEDLEVPYLDLTAPIQLADSAGVYLPGNTHYGPGGHRIVADSLHAFLIERILPHLEARSALSTPTKGPGM